MSQELTEFKIAISARNQGKGSINTKKEAIDLLTLSERAMAKRRSNNTDKEEWSSFLKTTGRSSYLKKLPDQEYRTRWAELAFKAIQVSEYTLRDLFQHRLEEFRNDILFQDMSSSTISQLTYDQVDRHVKEIATSFYSAVKTTPRVAIYCDNRYNNRNRKLLIK